MLAKNAHKSGKQKKNIDYADLANMIQNKTTLEFLHGNAHVYKAGWSGGRDPFAGPRGPLVGGGSFYRTKGIFSKTEKTGF